MTRSFQKTAGPSPQFVRDMLASPPDRGEGLNNCCIVPHGSCTPFARRQTSCNYSRRQAKATNAERLRHCNLPFPQVAKNVTGYSTVIVAGVEGMPLATTCRELLPVSIPAGTSK